LVLGLCAGYIANAMHWSLKLAVMVFLYLQASVLFQEPFM